MLGSADAFVGWTPDGLLHRSVLLSLFVQSNLSLIHSRVYPPYFRRRSGKRCDANPIQYAWQIRRSRCNALLRKGVRWHHPKRSRFRVVVQQAAHVLEEDLVQSANDSVEDCTFAVHFHRDYVCAPMVLLRWFARCQTRRVSSLALVFQAPGSTRAP